MTLQLIEPNDRYMLKKDVDRRAVIGHLRSVAVPIRREIGLGGAPPRPTLHIVVG